MARYELKLPSMGESVAEAVVTDWLKKVGNPIEVEEAIVEVATDKVDSEVFSEIGGIVSEILFKVDEIVRIGQVMAIIKTQESADASTPPQQIVEILMQNISDIKETVLSPQIDSSGAERSYSPLVKNIAKQEGISLDELARIKGTGLSNRVTKDDILAYIAHKTQSKATTTVAPTPATPATASPIDQRSYTKHGEEHVEMSRMGRIIAERITLSKQTSAHIQSFAEVDITRIWQWRNKVKKAFEANEDEKFIFTPIFMEAVTKALIDFLMINISVEGTTIVKKKNINIGMATTLPDGNLIVPVIKNADELNLRDMAKVVNGFAKRVRANQLKPDEVKDGTYTVTNIGSFGNVFDTPTINQPQVGILTIGAIQKVPAVIETPEGDVIGIRYKMMLSHSYDHRVISGALGGMFVQRVAQYLEEWDMSRTL